MFIAPFTETTIYTEVPSKKGLLAWIEEGENFTKDEKSSQTWGVMYSQ